MTMAGLKDLAALLGQEPPKAEETDAKKRGYDGTVVRLKIRTEQRRGKTITIAQGFQSTPKELQRILAACKARLGTGGQVLDNVIELQGEHKDRLRAMLIEEGYKVA